MTTILDVHELLDSTRKRTQQPLAIRAKNGKLQVGLFTIPPGERFGEFEPLTERISFAEVITFLQDYSVDTQNSFGLTGSKQGEEAA